MKIVLFLAVVLSGPLYLRALQKNQNLVPFQPLNAANWVPKNDGRVYAIPELWRKFKLSWNRTKEKEQQTYEKLIIHLQEKLSECAASSAQEEAYYKAKNCMIAQWRQEREKLAALVQKKAVSQERFKAMSHLQKITDQTFEEMLTEHFLKYTSAYPLSVQEMEEIYQLERTLWHKKIADGSLVENSALSQRLAARLLQILPYEKLHKKPTDKKRA